MASTSWIIRLQNLPWEASAGDVRSFFAGLKIPDGAVHIVGGDQGDAFIGFATDDDARLAMRRDGQQLKSAQVKLYLSSRKEMEDVVAAARCQYGPAAGGDADSVASGQTAGGAQSHQHDQPPRQLRSPDKGAAPKPPFSHDSPSRQQQHLQRQQHQQQVLVSQHNVAAALRGTQPQHNPQPLPPQQQHQVQPPQQQVQPGVMYTAAMAAGRPGGPQFGQAPQPVPAAEQMAPFGSVPRQGQMGPPPNMSQQQQQQPPMQQPQPFGQPNQFDNFHPQHGGQLQQQQQPPPQPLAQFRAPLQSEQSGTPTAQAVADVMSQALGRQPQQHVQQQFPSAPLDNDGRPAAQQAWMQQQQQLQPPFQDGGRFQQTQHPHQDWRASRQPQRDDSYASQPPQRDSSYGSQMPQRDSYGSQMPQRDVKYGAQPPQRDAGYVAQQPQRDGGYGSQQPQRDGGYVSQQQQPPRDGGYGSQQQQPPRDVNYGSQQPQRDSNYRSQPPQRDGNYGSRPPQRDSSYGSQPPQRDVAAEAGGWRPRPDVHNVEQQGYESKYNQRMGNVQPSRGGGIGRSGGSDFNLPPQRSSRASFPPGPGAEPPFGRNVDHNDSPFSRGSGRAASRARGAAESFTPRGRGLSRGGGMERGSMERSSGGSMERGGFMERGGGSVDRRGGGGNLERGRFMDRGGGPAEPVGQSWRPEPAAAVAAAPLAVKSEPRDVKPDVGMSQVQKQFQKSLESATTAYKAEQQMMMQQQQQQRPPTPPKPNMPPVFGAQPGSLLDRVAPPHQLPQQPTAAEANRRGLGLLAPPPPQQRQLDAPPQQLLTGQQVFGAAQQHNAAGASPSLTSVVSLGQTNLPLNLAPSPLVASAQQQQQLQQQQQQQQQQQLQQQQQTQQHPQALLDINFSPFATKPPGDVGGANILDRRQSAANMLDRVPPPHDAAMGGTPTFGTAAAAFGGDAQPGKFAAPLLIQPSPLRYQKPQQVQLQQPPAAVPPSDAFGGILDRFYVRVSNIPRELLSRGPPAVELGRFFGRDLTLREADLHVDRHGRVAVVRVNSQRDVETIRTKNGIMNVVVGDSTVDEFDSVGRAAVQGSSGTTANASMGAAAAQQQQQQPTAAAAAPSLWVSLSNVPYRSTKADIDDWLTQHKMPMPLTIENKLAPNGRASDVWLLEFSKLGESASVLALNERRPSPVIAEKGTGRTRIVRISYTADRPTTLGKRGTRSRSPQHKFAPKPNRDRSPAVKKHRRSPEHQRNGDAHRPTAAGRGAPADKREPVKMGHGSGAGAKRRTPTPPKKAPTPETEFWVCASSLPSDMSAAAVRAQFIKATDCDVLDVRHRIDQGKAFVRLPSAEDKTRALRLDGKYVGLQRIVVRSCSMRDAHTSLDPEPPVAAPNAECNSGEDNLPHAHPPGHILYVPPGAAPPEAAKVPKKPNRALMDDLRKKFPGGGVLSISGLPRFQCKWCNKCCTWKSELRQHMRVHTGEKPFPCKQCDAKFTTSSSLIRHSSRHDSSLPHMCSLCKWHFANVPMLSKHCSTVHGIKLNYFQCQWCSKRFPFSRHLEEHVRVHTGEKPFQCKLCDAKFATNTCLKRHLSQHDSNLPHVCSLCKCHFSTPKGLSHHCNRAHGIKLNRFQCQWCGKCFPQDATLERHLRVHTGEKPFQCNQCDAKFTRDRCLMAHLARHDSSLPHVCSLCKCHFSSVQAVSLHSTTIHGVKLDKPFECEQCATRFKTGRCLEKHLPRHNSNLPHMCSLCKWHFATLQGLGKHCKAVHETTWVKSFQCKWCNKCWPKKSGLEQHLRVHSGAKPFECDQCGAKFAVRRNMERHAEERHDCGNRFVCPVCQWRYSTRSGRTKHIHQVHQGKRDKSDVGPSTKNMQYTRMT